jgi:hypothetical protein
MAIRHDRKLAMQAKTLDEAYQESARHVRNGKPLTPALACFQVGADSLLGRAIRFNLKEPPPSLALVQALLAAGANPDAPFEGDAPLVLALKGSDSRWAFMGQQVSVYDEIIRTLIMAGCNFRAPFATDSHPQEYAIALLVGSEKYELAHLLMAKGADPQPVVDWIARHPHQLPPPGAAPFVEEVRARAHKQALHSMLPQSTLPGRQRP